MGKYQIKYSWGLYKVIYKPHWWFFGQTITCEWTWDDAVNILLAHRRLNEKKE